MLIPESELMAQARRALREGRLDDAQGVLVNVVVVEPSNDEAWLMLAETMSDPQRKFECLERARRIDPRNPATQRALQALLDQAAHAKPVEQTAEQPTEAASAPAQETAAAPASPESVEVVSEPASAAEENLRPDLAQPILEYAETIAQAIIMSVDPSATRTLGAELVNQIEQARTHDKILTRRWTRSAGRDALVKYEKGLSTLITNLPQNDAMLPALRQERQRALELFRAQ